MGRNLKYVIIKGGVCVIFVVYDFDFLGVVNIFYVLVNVDYKLQFVLDRVYLGYLVSDLVMLEVMVKIKVKCFEFEGIIKVFSLLSGKGKKEMLFYLDICYELFEGLEDVGICQWYVILSKGINVFMIFVVFFIGGKVLGK